MVESFEVSSQSQILWKITLFKKAAILLSGFVPLQVDANCLIDTILPYPEANPIHLCTHYLYITCSSDESLH